VVLFRQLFHDDIGTLELVFCIVIGCDYISVKFILTKEGNVYKVSFEFIGSEIEL
jgi:hypothetical protein